MTATQSAKSYRWNDLPRDHPMQGVDRRRIIGEKVMISEIFLHEGTHVPTHSHENEQLAYIVSGAVKFGVGEEGSEEREELTLHGGEVLHIPSNLPHSADALQDSMIIDIFSPPSALTGVDQK